MTPAPGNGQLPNISPKNLTVAAWESVACSMGFLLGNGLEHDFSGVTAE